MAKAAEVTTAGLGVAPLRPKVVGTQGGDKNGGLAQVLGKLQAKGVVLKAGDQLPRAPTYPRQILYLSRQIL